MHQQLELLDIDLSEALPDVLDQGVHGEVFTRRWIVDLILDLVGYTPDRPLHQMTLVEPSCGTGAFVGAVAERVGAACLNAGVGLSAARHAVRATDLLPRNAEASATAVRAVLLQQGWQADAVDDVVGAWIGAEDFLLTMGKHGSADFVVGNPPYVRSEDISASRNRVYRRNWSTMIGRADIYVGFIEKALALLRPGGRLGYICADRWMRNQYGAELRQLIADSYSVQTIVQMHDVDAFESEVSAYPAVVVLANQSQQQTVIADANREFGESAARRLADFVGNGASAIRRPEFTGARLPHWFAGRGSWPNASPQRIRMLEELSERFPPLEDVRTGTKVGIGVATGADGIFVVSSPPDVEAGRLLPLSMVRDISSGTFDWSGHYLVNPWDEDGLVDLSSHPRLSDYLRHHHDRLRSRHVASKGGDNWYRTIDRVNIQLTDRPKLLIQDMRSSINPVLDPGGFYPHHNLYYVVSDKWDPRVLGAILMSGVANAFVEAYGVKMRGGTLRFQAQYLRRIRVPRIEELTTSDSEQLTAAFKARDVERATAVSLRLYGMAELPA